MTTNPPVTYTVAEQRCYSGDLIPYLVKIMDGAKTMTPFKTITEARKALAEIEAGPVCQHCGSFMAFSQANPHDVKEMQQRGCCSYCLHFLSILDSCPESFCADGRVYSLGLEDAKGPSHCRGFGGQKWRITKEDGTVFYSTNLWHNGLAPVKIAAMFPRYNLQGL